MKFEVVADSRSVSATEVEIGHGVSTDTSLKGVQRLKLVTALTTNQASCKNLTAQWADVQVVPA